MNDKEVEIIITKMMNVMYNIFTLLDEKESILPKDLLLKVIKDELGELHNEELHRSIYGKDEWRLYKE